MTELFKRKALLDEVQRGLQDGSLSFGAAIARLRQEILGVPQADFARMCGIAPRTLAQLEKGSSTPTIATLDALLAPFGLQMGFIARQPLQVKR